MGQFVGSSIRSNHASRCASVGGSRLLARRWTHRAPIASTPPSDEALDAWFDLVEDPANWPIYVHCQSGIHRTGLYVALFRMQYPGWSPERALNEMRANGFRWGRGDRIRVEAYVLAYRPDKARRLPTR